MNAANTSGSREESVLLCSRLCAVLHSVSLGLVESKTFNKRKEKSERRKIFYLLGRLTYFLGLSMTAGFEMVVAGDSDACIGSGSELGGEVEMMRGT